MALKRKMEAAKAKDAEDSIAQKVKLVPQEDGTNAFKFAGSQKNLPPKLKAVIQHILHTEKKKHNKYCPCCKNYREGEEPTVEQMGEFLEFIRQQHIKVHGKQKNLMKRIKLKDERLEHDSVSDITDLSD